MTVGTESLLPENERRQNPSDPLSPLRSREVPGRYIVIGLVCLGSSSYRKNWRKPGSLPGPLRNPLATAFRSKIKNGIRSTREVHG